MVDEAGSDPSEGHDSSPLCRRASPSFTPVSSSSSSTSTTSTPSLEGLHLLSFPDEILLRVLSHLDGREVEESGQACKRLLRLTKDDYLWFMMTKRLVKRERAERWRKQAHDERREAQLKRRLSSHAGAADSSHGLGCKHGRTDEAAAQEGEQMEMEDKPDAPDATGSSSSSRPLMAHDDDDGAHDDGEGDEGDGDYECGCAEKEEAASGAAAVVAAGVGRRKTRSAAGPAEERRRKMKAQMQTYDLRKPAARDWKWVYRCKTTILLQPHTDKVTGVGRYTWSGGSYYEGEWKDGKPEGLGTKVWGENEFYEGEWKNGKMHFGVYKWPDGAYYEGQWREGLHEGYGVYRWADGNKYEGFWRGGHRDGYGVRTWPDGDVFEGDWVAGKRTGKGTYSWPNGSRYEGEWSNGCHHGYGVYTWLDGRRYEGQWDYNKKEGVGTYYFGHEGCAYTGHWEDGYRHGQGVMTWEDGTKYVGLWLRDQRVANHGQFVGPNGLPVRSPHAGLVGPRPYDQYFVEEESAWEAKYRGAINRKRMEVLQRLKANGKLPYPIREDKVLDPEG